MEYVINRILTGVFYDNETSWRLEECVEELMELGDKAVKTRLLFNLDTVLSSPSRRFLECVKLALNRFGCTVLTNEYEFYEMVYRCTYRSTLFTVDIVGVKQTLPGFYQVTIRVCDRYFELLRSNQFAARVIPSPVASSIDVVELSGEEDPEEDACVLQKHLFIVSQAGKYTIRYILEYKSGDKGPEGKLVLPATHIIRFHSPRPPDAYYRVKGYGFRREMVVQRSDLEPMEFGDVYPASYRVELPSTWWCRRLYTAGSHLEQYACLRLDLGLAALVYMPREGGGGGVSREEWDSSWGELARYKYVEQPLGFSPSRRALFFVPPAYGTFQVYVDRVSEIDEETVETIKAWLDDALQAYQEYTGRSHEALYPWNIYIDSVGLRIGPPRGFLNKLLGTSIPPLDDSKAEKEIVKQLLRKARNTSDNYSIIFFDEIQEHNSAADDMADLAGRLVLSRLAPLIDMLRGEKEKEE
ncbi:MAG: hypothetical protein F7C33_04230 [Desulfurococcales archaeon]|nr:hypothetical protein [Desulfurococcales archaeon]